MVCEQLVSEEHDESKAASGLVGPFTGMTDLQLTKKAEHVQKNDITVWIDPLDATQEYTGMMTFDFLCFVSFYSFWPTVLSVEPLVQCVVCLSVICNVLYCGKTVRPSEKVSEGVNRKPGSKSSFFGSLPYFYFRFCRYSYRDGRFCLIFARTAKQSVLDGRN